MASRKDATECAGQAKVGEKVSQIFRGSIRGVCVTFLCSKEGEGREEWGKPRWEVDARCIRKGKPKTTKTTRTLLLLCARVWEFRQLGQK